MAKKMEFNDVKYFIEVESNSGCELISVEYKKAKSPLEIKCSCGNTFITSFNTFKHNNKRTCDECSEQRFSNKLKMNKRTDWNYETVKKFIESFNGHKLISDEYKNAKVKLNILCPNNHEFEMNLNDFKSGHRCNFCKTEEISNALKLDFCYIKNFIETSAIGYELLSDEYISTNDKLIIKCNNNHVFNMTFHCFKDSKQRCPICAIEKRSGENHWNWQGGIAPERSSLMVKFEYKNWRMLVFKRDNFTCQCCGNSSRGDLEAHHIESFSNNKELRYEISNGIALCKYCHNSRYKGSFHNIYGTQNINSKMFNEYLYRRKQGEFDSLILSYEGGEKRIGRKEKVSI